MIMVYGYVNTNTDFVSSSIMYYNYSCSAFTPVLLKFTNVKD